MELPPESTSYTRLALIANSVDLGLDVSVSSQDKSSVRVNSASCLEWLSVVDNRPISRPNPPLAV